jgi:hypothetical protein
MHMCWVVVFRLEQRVEKWLVGRWGTDVQGSPIVELLLQMQGRSKPLQRSHALLSWKPENRTASGTALPKSHQTTSSRR